MKIEDFKFNSDPENLIITDSYFINEDDDGYIEKGGVNGKYLVFEYKIINSEKIFSESIPFDRGTYKFESGFYLFSICKALNIQSSVGDTAVFHDKPFRAIVSSHDDGMFILKFIRHPDFGKENDVI